MQIKTLGGKASLIKRPPLRSQDPHPKLEHDRVLEPRPVFDQGGISTDVGSAEPRGDHAVVKLQLMFMPAEVPVQPSHP